MRNPYADNKLAKIGALSTPYNVNVGGLEMAVFKNVYPTSELSELIIECLDDNLCGIAEGDSVLDFGTGTGFLAIQAAIKGGKVLATDINPDALECASYNVKQQLCEESIDLLQSDGFDSIPINEKFDIILAGLPWDDGIPENYLEMSMYDNGFKMRKALFDNAILILNNKGRIFFTYSQQADERYPIEKFDNRFNYVVFKKRVIKSVMHYAYMIYPKNYNVV